VLRPSVTKIVAHQNVPGLQRRQAAENHSETAQGLRGRDLHADLEGQRRERDGLGEVLRSWTHERRRGLSVRTGQHGPHGRPDVSPASPRRGLGRPARRCATGSSASSRW
jgi:hypothetical protein